MNYQLSISYRPHGDIWLSAVITTFSYWLNAKLCSRLRKNKKPPNRSVQWRISTTKFSGGFYRWSRGLDRYYLFRPASGAEPGFYRRPSGIKIQNVATCFGFWHQQVGKKATMRHAIHIAGWRLALLQRPTWIYSECLKSNLNCAPECSADKRSRHIAPHVPGHTVKKLTCR